MKIKFVQASCLLLILLGSKAFADVVEMRCNWYLTSTGNSKYQSPAKCGSPAVVQPKPGKWKLDMTKAQPADCPKGFTQAGDVQGGIIGSVDRKGTNYLLEARRICIK